MINEKRILLLCGHYGSGKTNIAVNLAMRAKQKHEKVALADLDIVNPYFRSKDSSEELNAAGIRLICSEYANTNVDIPALPQDMYAVTDDRSIHAIIDVGGDDRGALALGRLSPAILAEGDYEMLMVINRYRPLTRDAASVKEVMQEIEVAGGIPFTGVINNSTLGRETTVEDVRASVAYANEVSEVLGLPLVMTAVDERLAAELEGEIPDLLPLRLQKKI